MRSAAGDDTPASQADHRLTAFGLEVRCAWPLTGSHPASGGTGRCSGRSATHIRQVPATELEAAWQEPAERIFTPEFPDGRTRFTVDRNERRYRLWAEDYGRYLIACDGSWIATDQDPPSPAAQERFLFAQALPVAAALHGYEVLHASAVCGAQGAAAFVGASGAGKTAVATRVLLRGAQLMTDDVLAVQIGPELLAHPGPPFMALRPQEAGMAGAGGEPLGASVGASDKLHVARPTPGGPRPLRAVYHLRRGPAAAISRLGPEARHLVLGHAFVPYVMTPQRMLHHLQLAELVSSGMRQFELQTPRDGLDEATIDLLAGHLREQGLA